MEQSFGLKKPEVLNCRKKQIKRKETPEAASSNSDIQIFRHRTAFWNVLGFRSEGPL